MPLIQSAIHSAIAACAAIVHFPDNSLRKVHRLQRPPKKKIVKIFVAAVTAGDEAAN
jgi:hypothetical protein